jgi:homoserine O-succinyltransferase
MAIMLPKGLPARHALKAEGVALRNDAICGPGGARPLRVALLNLMPRKTTTEIQIARLLSATPHAVDLTLAVPDSYISGKTPAFHIAAFYKRWSAIRDMSFDALIVTGAPIEHLPFEDVTYWPEITDVFEWATQKVGRSYYICWAAQAALYHFHGVPKRKLEQKRFGVFEQTILRPSHPLFDGLRRDFPVCISRHTETWGEDLPRNHGLDVLAASPQTGLCLVEDRDRHALYMFNHLEYDADTLAEEYLRDREAGLDISIPANYFPFDDPARQPLNVWHPHARRIFRNWLGDMAERPEAALAAGA